MTQFGRFHHLWIDWDAKLSSIVERAGARLLFPQLKERGQGNDVFKLEPGEPVCIFAAPQKGSSRKRGPSHRQVIFVGGSFTFVTNGSPSPRMTKGDCNISIFDYGAGPGETCRLTQVDAMHFDMEKSEAPTAFHPTFHMQRGHINTLTDAAIRALVHRATRIDPSGIEISRDGSLGTPYIRVPTPQMDMLSALVVVAADFFCNGGDKDPRAKTLFQALLKLLVNEDNAAREGVSAQALRVRASNAGYTSSGLWYAECV